MPQDGRRSVGYRPFVACGDTKGVVECGTIRKYSKSNFHKMEPSNEARVRLKSSNGAVDREELSKASFQMLEVSKGAQKLNHVIESWSNGLGVEGQPREIAKDLLKGALDLQESLMMLGKLQAASKYVAQLKQKSERPENSARPSEIGHGREIGFGRLEVSPGDESYKEKLEELREVIRGGLAKQNQLNRRKFEPHFGIPSTSSSQSSSANCDEKDDLIPDEKAKGLNAPNIIARLMGLEEMSVQPIQRKLLERKIVEQQKPEVDNDKPKLKKPVCEVWDDEPDRKTLTEILDNVRFKRPLKSNSIRQTWVFDAEDVPPIVLIKPSRRPCPVSRESVLEVKGASNAMTALKSLKASEKFPSRRIDRDGIVCDLDRIHETPQLKEILRVAPCQSRQEKAQGFMERFPSRRICDSDRKHEAPQLKEILGIASCQERGSTRPNKEISRHEKAQGSERDSNNSRHPSPPVKEQVVKEQHGTKYGRIEKPKKSSRGSPEKSHCKAKSSQQSEDQVKANAPAKIKPENKPNRTTREVSPQKAWNSRQDQKKGTSTPDMQRSKKAVSNHQTRTPSQNCGNRNRSPRKIPPLHEPKEVTAVMLDKNNATMEEGGIKIDTTSRSDSVQLEMNTGNEDPYLTEENASESGVGGVPNSCNGIEHSPSAHSLSTSELGTQTNGYKLDFEGFETGDRIKSLLLSSPSFLSHAEDLFVIVSDPPALLQKPRNVDSISPSERLLVDYANELMECRTFYPSISSLVVGLGSLRTQISLDKLLEEILKGIENLSSYFKLASNSFLMDGLYERLRIDLSVHRESVSKLWDAGWTKGFCLEDVEQVANEVEENVLGSLIEETLVELMQLAFPVHTSIQ